MKFQCINVCKEVFVSGEEKNLNFKLEMFERKQENISLQIFARKSIMLLKVSGVSLHKKKYFVRPLLKKKQNINLKLFGRKQQHIDKLGDILQEKAKTSSYT